MDRHERFMAERTTEVSVLFGLNCSGASLSRIEASKKLVKFFLYDIRQNYSLNNSWNHTQTLYTSLCSVYQVKVKYKSLTGVCLFSPYEMSLASIGPSNIQQSLNTIELDSKILPLVLDILVLCMVLYYKVPSILEYLGKLQELIQSRLVKEKNIGLTNIKLLICYMDSLFLHGMDCPLQKTDVEGAYALLENNMEVCFRSKDLKEYQQLTLLLPKIFESIGNYKIVKKMWEMVFTLRDDPGETLSILCLTADVWFPIESKYDEQLIRQAIEEPFWLLLLKGLSSQIPLKRKQALYLIKRAVDFAEKHETGDFKLKQYQGIRPLIYTGDEFQKNSFKKSLNNFFLILEALEEKQKHLVQPVFPLLKNLFNETLQQESSTTIHIAWIRCAFLRILQHDNNAIVKSGLRTALTLDPKLYDDEFLSEFLVVLNNTYLYESNSNEKEPIIVEELTIFLNYAESLRSDLVTRFIVEASKITWGPIALFYVIHALSMVKTVNSIWREEELRAVKSLAEINLTMHCRILRIGSQIKLLDTLTHFATDPLDFVTVANTLSAFSTSEALVRGQLAWNRISTWLSKIIKQEDAVHSLEKICQQMRFENAPSYLSSKTLSLMIMLFYDSRLILNFELCPSLHCLIEAAGKPCVNIELRNRSIQLISNLLELISSEENIFCELISKHVDAILGFIFKKLRNVINDTDIDEIAMYGVITEQLFTTENTIIQKLDILVHIERFENEACNIIEDGGYTNNVRRFFGIRVLYACLKAANKKYIDYKFIGPLYTTYRTLMIQSSEGNEGAKETSILNVNLTGKIAAEYYEFVAKLFHMYIQDDPVDKSIPDIDWVEEVSYLIQVGGNGIFVPIIEILTRLYKKGAISTTNIDNFKSTLELCWKLTLESTESRSALQKIIELMFSTPFLESTETRETTKKCINEMISKGDHNPGLSIILLQGLEQANGKFLSDFYDALLSCLLYGTVPRRDQKIELRARSYILDCYERAYPNYLSNIDVNFNAATRAHAVTLLHKIINEDGTHAVNLLQLIVTKLNESHNKRYFGDSQIHRLKNRIMQVLLVLQPVLQEENIDSLYLLMCDNMLSESSQPSVRIMQEWLLIRIYLESDTLRSKIWDLFNRGQDNRVGSLCSVASVVYQVARLLSPELQQDFIDLALQNIMPCCMAQQFNVRLYAQVIVAKLYDLAVEMSYLTVIEKYKELHIAVTKSLKYGNLMKNSIKLQDDFYFTVFHPIDHYNLQTLFCELPRLSNVSSDEYIPVRLFEKFGFKDINSHPLKLFNSSSDLSKAQVSEHILKSSGSAGPVADDIDSSVDSSTDMQKKFIPWKTMIPNEDELSEISETLVSCKKRLAEGNNIILIASLIEKLPNLGGLSRTCEILGVKEFVVPSIKHTDDKEFQSLSVSAEKLITLVEVKPHQLRRYLLEKKAIGYRLVGAEQTVNSTNLMNMKFDPKTVLLLGNEKAGIPANLIPLLDDCVEIPQVGVVRSLNVHVTGAMCLWEYFKQHHSS